jgi:HK97 family phage major capsid protein
MNIQGQIKSFTDARAVKAAALKVLLEKSEVDGETLDAKAAEEYDAIEKEIETIDTHLARLAKSEKLLASTATKITVETDEDPIVAARKANQERDARAGHQRVVAVEKKLPPGIGFTRFVKLMAMSNGNARDAFEQAKSLYPEETPLHNIIKMHFGQGQSTQFIEKATVDAALTSNSAFAGALVQYQDLASEFIEFLRPQTIIGKLTAVRRVPFKVRVKRQTGGGTAGWVGEGKAKPLTSQAFDTVLLDFTKIAAITVITDETLRLSTPGADMLVRNDLAAAIVQQLDSDFIDPANAGSGIIKPASITNGAATAVATGTNTQAGIATDIMTAFAPFISGNQTPVNCVWIMSPVTAMALGLMVNSLGNKVFPGVDINGGVLEGLPIIVSNAAGIVGASDGAHIVVLLKQDDVLLADDGQVAVDASREASLEMSDAPSNSSATGTGASLVSMFQTNSVALRAERWINWKAARSQAAFYLTGVHWGGFPV